MAPPAKDRPVLYLVPLRESAPAPFRTSFVFHPA